MLNTVRTVVAKIVNLPGDVQFEFVDNDSTLSVFFRDDATLNIPISLNQSLLLLLHHTDQSQVGSIGSLISRGDGNIVIDHEWFPTNEEFIMILKLLAEHDHMIFAQSYFRFFLEIENASTDIEYLKKHNYAF